MSNKLITKTALSLAVSSALMASVVNAQTANSVSALNNYTATSFTASETQEQSPSAHMIVLHATTAADLMTQGTYQAGDSRATIAQIEQVQSEVTLELSSLDFGAKIIGQTKVLAPTLIVQASPEALERIALDRRVAKVLPMYDYELHVAASADYLNASPLVSTGVVTGKGQTVAVLDTGIDYTHKIFGGAGTVEAYDAAQADPTSVAWPQGQVQGGYDYVRDDADPIENDPAEPTEANAPTSHGTSVSHSVTGIAPEVELYVYSVCGGGCSGAAQAAALESAMDPNGDGDISDRVDVINMSLGGEFGGTYIDGGAQLLIQKAVDLGVNVVISAGNDSDNPFRVGGPSTTPNALSVGAMTHPTLESDVLSGTVDGAEVELGSASFGAQGEFTFGSDDAELVYPDANQNGCDAFADDVDFTGKAVVIDRGACGFSVKALNAQNKGAAFVVLANNTAGAAPGMGASPGAEAVTIRTVSVTQEVGVLLKEKLAAGEQPVYSFTGKKVTQAGAVATFSSRGPSMAGLLKPEITAPGTSIMVAATGTQDKLAPASGTSFSGPITAGAVALVREAHPERNALEIKATLMNSANLNVTNEPLSTTPDSELAPISMIGAGLVDVEKAVNLPVAAWVNNTEFSTKQAALSFGLENIKEITSFTKTVTVKNFSTDEKTYNLRTEARYSNDDETGAISWNIPASVMIPAGQTVEFDVTLTVDPSKLHEWKLENPFSAEDIAARSPALTLAEFDGALVFDDVDDTNSDHALHVVYHALPKAATELSLASEVVGNSMQLIVENTGATTVSTLTENIVAEGVEKSAEEAPFNVISSTFNALAVESCDSGVLFTASIQLRDELTHVFQAGYRLDIDTNNDGAYDFLVQNYNDRGRRTASPGRTRTVIGTIDETGVETLRYLTPLYHSAGEDTITFSACSNLIGLNQDNLGDTLNIKASVGYAAYNGGVYFETDNIVGSTTFSTSAPVSLTAIDGTDTPVRSLAPGEKAIVNATAPFAFTSTSLQDVVKLVTAEDLTLPSIEAPMLESATFDVAENSENGHVVGTIVVSASNKDVAISEFYVQSKTHQGFDVNNNGEVIVTNSDVVDFEKGLQTAELVVVAIDIQGNVSEPVALTINITNLADEGAEVTPVVTIEQSFSVQENVTTGTVIGTLAVTDPDADATPIASYIVTGSDLVSVSEAGEITVSGAIDYETITEIKFMVSAVDTAGHTSEAVEVVVAVTQDPAEDVVVPEPKKKSSGSLAWLTLLAAPFAFMRRRKQK
ncbi:S8 family serine peptidase [Pseudoalteromonas sp. NEC-BIFX-2020_002]|uniref:S8 family serine peptidase n=1 Tax=Pseudoalteromonas sp. NEC-BIFX-2020_002 TaxID=2732353 RepID=UPI001476A972|nr:S8 family serine peptidase [Pseudoalteromonas sp. NEC-BIFX-2020_002]NNG42641.1 S8 family serine peptidase [Pseudoalteromonas sp. NEC-BIFX-2020_002]